MKVEIDNDTALEMLMDRVRFWTDDPDVIELYEKMYSDYVDEGVFEGGEFDVMQIVDNDYVNYCGTISPEDEHFSEIVEAFKNGDRDISCSDFGYSYVEAVNEDETLALVRY